MSMPKYFRFAPGSSSTPPVWRKSKREGEKRLSKVCRPPLGEKVDDDKEREESKNPGGKCDDAAPHQEPGVAGQGVARRVGDGLGDDGAGRGEHGPPAVDDLVHLVHIRALGPQGKGVVAITADGGRQGKGGDEWEEERGARGCEGKG